MHHRLLVRTAVAGLLLVGAAACADDDSPVGAGRSTTAPAPVATPSPTASPDGSSLPAGFVFGRYGHAAKPSDLLTFSPPHFVRLNYEDGSTYESVDSPEAGVLVFSRDSHLCAAYGTYHYTMRGKTLVISVVTDTCGTRRDFVPGTWELLD